VNINTGLVGKHLASAGIPIEVDVPRLHVHSGVIPISGQSGELVPPSNPQLLGWWKEGRRVGEAQGSAVVTGHTVSVGGGAFDHLGELVPGDHIKVRTAAGSIEYVVRQSRDVPVAKLARTAKEIFRLTGPGRLVLITCSDFNGHVYLSNSVVYAVPIKDKPRAK
jgi:LPXTG-site transpeptidase (sortase) family protein